MLYLPNTLVGKAAEQYQPKIFCLILNNQVALSRWYVYPCFRVLAIGLTAHLKHQSAGPSRSVLELRFRQTDGWRYVHGWLSNCIEDVDLVLSMWCQRTFLGTRQCLWQVRHAEIAPNKSENSGSLQMTSGWRLDRSKRYFAGLQTLRLRCRGCNVFFSFFMRFPNA